MFGLPLWAISLIIQILEQLGLFNWAERMAVKTGITIVKSVENAQVEYTYPTGRNGDSKIRVYARNNLNQ